MLALIVLSRDQDILNGFFESLFPTIKGKDVHIYVISITCTAPEDERVTLVRSTEFAPNKYFNQVRELLPDDCYQVGIVNDDIEFSEGWYEDVMEKLVFYDCVSPGFVESARPILAEYKEKTKNETGTVFGMFQSFYVFKTDVFKKIGTFDNDIITWYDIDWYWRMRLKRLGIVTSKKVTIRHFGSQTYKREGKVAIRRKKQFKYEFSAKHGILNKATAKREAKKTKSYFFCE